MKITTTLEVSCMRELLKTNLFACGELAERRTRMIYPFPGNSGLRIILFNYYLFILQYFYKFSYAEEWRSGGSGG
jgi:hypothetical protein